MREIYAFNNKCETSYSSVWRTRKFSFELLVPLTDEYLSQELYHCCYVYANVC